VELTHPALTAEQRAAYPDYVGAALKEMLLLVYSLHIYPTEFEIWRNSYGDYGFTLKRDPAFEKSLAEARP
jgi:hypothetical protein